MLPGLKTDDGWTRIPIASVEDLSDAVLGAGLEVTQMSRAPVTGSLAFATLDGRATCTSGYIDGRVTLTGPLSANMVTLGVGVVMAPGTRHWLNEVTSGAVGVFLPGDEHDALYTPGSIYVALTLSGERLEESAAARDLVLDSKMLGGTGVHAKKLVESYVFALERQFRHIHAAREDALHTNPRAVTEHLLQRFITHFARAPRFQVGGIDPRGHARVVARARAFIHANLDQPLSIDKIASASATSHRTLHRAFQMVLDETPYSYVQKLRLHRIRHELVSDAEAVCTITNAALRWNIAELGRFAGWYRELFGELPSQTLARHRQTQPWGPHRHTPQREEHRILAASA
jgi:AraC-like DNA-binding protein